ncbi:Dynein beta chain ciliary protein [Citrus sinensis]|uniref:Dynein beta chain ciliary protein n=1 Tax=Citrus sinensis TaxID=2711 RepID=A0ACB8I8U5_CITSI|nr:Dynein beta chain ciliary protein [Citrus sinensis]
MGQAFRRASGRITSSSSTTSSSSKTKNVVDRGPRVVPTDKKISRTGPLDGGDHREGNRPVNTGNVLEERDPQYDAMLNQMLGRVKTKAGGKAEMGEAAVVERQTRPLPKLRNTTPVSSRYEEKPSPPGTLNVAQLRRIMLLHQGKAADHNGPMDAKQIAEKFRLDVLQVQTILQCLSLPPENSNKERNYP